MFINCNNTNQPNKKMRLNYSLLNCLFNCCYYSCCCCCKNKKDKIDIPEDKFEWTEDIIAKKKMEDEALKKALIDIKIDTKIKLIKNINELDFNNNKNKFKWEKGEYHSTNFEIITINPF